MARSPEVRRGGQGAFTLHAALGLWFLFGFLGVVVDLCGEVKGQVCIASRGKCEKSFFEAFVEHKRG